MARFALVVASGWLPSLAVEVVPSHGVDVPPLLSTVSPFGLVALTLFATERRRWCLKTVVVHVAGWQAWWCASDCPGRGFWGLGEIPVGVVGTDAVTSADATFPV